MEKGGNEERERIINLEQPSQLRDFILRADGSKKNRVSHVADSREQPHFNFEVDVPFTSVQPTLFLRKTKYMDQTLIALYKDKHELLGGSEAKLKFIVRLTVTKEGG